MNGQSATATPRPRKLEMTSPELFPHVPNDCKMQIFKKNSPLFPLSSRCLLLQLCETESLT